MQQLQVGNAPMSRYTTKCVHGLGKIGSICTTFVIAFKETYSDAARGGAAFSSLIRAKNATWDDFAEVWKDSAKKELARSMSYFLHCGVLGILEGSNKIACKSAVFARYFEQWTALKLHKTQALINLPKIEELTIRASTTCTKK